MDLINQNSGFEIRNSVTENEIPESKIRNYKSQVGMTLIAVMAVMTLFAISLLAVAPAVQQEIQRERELEAIRRGEEIAEAIRQYTVYYQGRKLPNSMDDLLDGLPNGTKKRMILRPSAAIDPLSEDGKWQLVPISKMKNFARRVQSYNNGLLPSSETVPPSIANQIGYLIVNVNSQTDDEVKGSAEDTDEETFTTEDTPFIGVASRSKSVSVIAYYGIENHSKWVFTPLFRGTGVAGGGGQNRAVPNQTTTTDQPPPIPKEQTDN